MPLPALPDLIRIPAGEFVMGSDTGEEDEGPPHLVSLDSFELGAYPVTVAQYARFVRETGHRTPGVHELPLIVTTGGREREQAFRATAGAYTWAGGDAADDRQDHPVTLVRWEDAAAYCAWLSTLVGRPIRLPTEAEWEYAALGGRDGLQYPWGVGDPKTKARYNGNDPSGVKTVARDAFPANAFGLFNMAGNVAEWVHDFYGENYYKAATRRNPVGPPAGSERVVRGGNWDQGDDEIRCASRDKRKPNEPSDKVGFRVVVIAAPYGGQS